MLKLRVQKLAWNLIDFLASNPRYREKLSFDDDDIVVIYDVESDRVRNIVNALDRYGVNLVLIKVGNRETGEVSEERRGIWKCIITYPNIRSLLNRMPKECKNVNFIIFIQWNYEFAAHFLCAVSARIYIDSYDYLTGNVTKGFAKKNLKLLNYEKFVLESATGVICRDLRTNSAKRHGFKIKKRILFMDYFDQDVEPMIRKKLEKSLAYVGNLEADRTSPVAFQYEIWKRSRDKEITFTIFPKYKHLANTLRMEFSCITKTSDSVCINDIVQMPKSFKCLRESLKDFSFGLLISTINVGYESHDTYGEDMGKLFFSKKIFDYISVGMYPIVQNGAFVRFVLRRLGVGAVVTSMDEIPEVIISESGKIFEISIPRSFYIDSNITRLINFLKN